MTEPDPPKEIIKSPPANQTPDNNSSQSGQRVGADTLAKSAVLFAAISLPYFIAPLAGKPALGATLIAAAIALAFIIITASFNWMRIIATIGWP